MSEVVPAAEPDRRPTLSPDPEQIWRPGPRRALPPEEVGPFWRHMEPARVVLALIALIVVIMVLMVALVLTHI